MTTLVIIILVPLFIYGVVSKINERQERLDAYAQRVSALAAPLPKNEPEEILEEIKRESFGVTLDLKKLVRMALNDPETKEMIFDAIRQGPMPYTDIIGATNFSSKKNPKWYSVFLGVNRKLKPGDPGFLMKNKRGDRISLRLKKQEVRDHTAQTPGKILPDTNTNEELHKALTSGDPAIVSKLAALVNKKNSHSLHDE